MGKQKPLNVVLVHGGFVDGSGWKSVHAILKADGHDVSIVKTPPFRSPVTSRPRSSFSRHRTAL